MFNISRKASLASLASLAAVAATFVIAAADNHSRDRRPAYGPIDEITWTKTPIGPDASPVSGDFTKGKHITYLRFPGKFKTPVHTHTADYTGIVLAGSARHYIEGDAKTEKLLGVGSFWQMPANVKHISECVSETPCVFAVIQDSKFDFLPAK